MLLDFLYCFVRVADSRRAALYGHHLCIICVVMLQIYVTVFSMMTRQIIAELSGKKTNYGCTIRNIEYIRYLNIMSYPRHPFLRMEEVALAVIR